MKKPLTSQELTQFAASHPLREAFGPNSGNPYIAFDLAHCNPSLSKWLSGLPCPVIGIGIGIGALSSACDVVLATDKKLPILNRNIIQTPLAAMALVQHLRASESLSLDKALTAESFAYAAVQNGPEFQAWLSGHQGTALPITNEPQIITQIDDNILSLTLNQPNTRNAIDVDMRDALCEALDLAIINTDISKVKLAANGTAFCVGGAREEFGKASDPATAHWIRSLRLPASRLTILQDKLEVHVNGAAIGAGAEITAFGSHVTASSKAWFQLPELKYGLIPGAGGTVSLPRRIGRQRTAYMALSMEKIRAEKALEWGLIDAIID